MNLYLSLTGDWESIEAAILLLLSQIDNPLVRECGLDLDMDNPAVKGKIVLSKGEVSRSLCEHLACTLQQECLSNVECPARVHNNLNCDLMNGLAGLLNIEITD
jgi:hypothetical protein